MRAPVHAWETTAALAAVFGRPEPALVPIQLPSEAGEPWLAMQFPKRSLQAASGCRRKVNACCTQRTTRRRSTAGAHQCGLLLDEWTEVIPATTKEAGLTFNFDRPDNEAPQAILACHAREQRAAPGNGTTSWARSTRRSTSRRSARVEPAQIEPTPYSRLLPATIMAVTLYGISITTALAVTDGVLASEEVALRG